MRAALDYVGDDFGWGAKCAVLIHYPQVIRVTNGDGGMQMSTTSQSAVLSSGSSTTSLSTLGGLTRASSMIGGGSTGPPMSTFGPIPLSLEGHYSHGLEGCSSSEKREVRGAFDALYAYLVEVLASSHAEGDTSALQLAAIQCLGVRVTEDDHTMLSRVNVFYALEELMESALSMHHSASTPGTEMTAAAGMDKEEESKESFSKALGLFQPSLSSGAVRVVGGGLGIVTGEQGEEEDGTLGGGGLTHSAATARTVTQAAMKLFILLALQVATSGEREMSYIVRQSSSSSLLRRSRSGPATLSKAVFDILYVQLASITAAMNESFAAVSRTAYANANATSTNVPIPLAPPPEEQKGHDSVESVDAPATVTATSTTPLPDVGKPPVLVPPTLQILVSHDAGVILMEALTLLTTISQELSCQRLLARPKWFALLVKLALVSPTVCRQKSLQLLSDLLPDASIDALEGNSTPLLATRIILPLSNLFILPLSDPILLTLSNAIFSFLWDRRWR